ncbi:hypothetical protein V497_07538 [Pseudogymnoascus sp. VKM F-4516 (FW-969)]|nr:hypothetical protein V490_03708 [Pseudogymnoascus sp. VKM F-3557]KFY54674.1 hypothetical protein V497_07538 [Pseudogymnoascus sp. VKM F-4516 (FW-969)]
MDSKQFKEAATSAIDEIVSYYDTLPDRKVLSSVEPGYLRKLLPSGPPEKGESWTEIQKDIEEKIVPGLTHWQHPNFMAFFPASSSFPGMLGELYSAAFTAPAFNWICSPAVTELETVVLDWLAKLLNLPDCYLSTGEGGGVIQGSASEAIVTVMVAARDKYLRETTSHLSGEEQEDAIAHKRSKLVALGSDQAHSSTHKAALIAGVRYKSVPTTLENNFALTGAALLKTINELKAKGLEPFYLTCNLGTTSTCAVDDFCSITSALRTAAPAGPGEIWVHVDAAYAGSALVCPEYHHLTAHFGSFHSFDMNMHKWLLTNFDASCLFIRKRKDLIDALSVTPSYLRNEHSESGLVTDYRDWQIPLGRRFRSLKIWFVMRTYGVEGMQAHIRRHVKLGDVFHDLVKKREDLFEVIGEPRFALTTFTLKAKEGEDREEVNRISKEVYETVNSGGVIYITSSVVGGIYILRVVSANELAEEKYVLNAFDIIVKTTEEVRAGKLTNGSNGVNGVNGVKTVNGANGKVHHQQLVEEGGGKGLGEVTDANGLAK